MAMPCWLSAAHGQVQYTSGGFKRFPMAEFKQLVTDQKTMPERLGADCFRP